MLLVGWFDEWSSDLDEVIEVSVLISGSTWVGDFGFVLFEHITEDLIPSFIGKFLSSWKVSFLFRDSLVEELLNLVLKRGFSSVSQFLILIQVLELQVVHFVGVELERMDVVGHEFEFSISLIGESSGTTMLDLLGWSFTGHWNSEHFSEGNDESLLLQVSHTKA